MGLWGVVSAIRERRRSEALRKPAEAVVPKDSGLCVSEQLFLELKALSARCQEEVSCPFRAVCACVPTALTHAIMIAMQVSINDYCAYGHDVYSNRGTLYCGIAKCAGSNRHAQLRAACPDASFSQSKAAV